MTEKQVPIIALNIKRDELNVNVAAPPRRRQVWIFDANAASLISHTLRELQLSAADARKTGSNNVIRGEKPFL